MIKWTMILMVFMLGCGMASKPLPPDLEVGIDLSSPYELYWTNTTQPHPERDPWTQFLNEHFISNISDYDKATDVSEFCPLYPILNVDQKVKVWGELLGAIVYYEAKYIPTSAMVETTMDIDPVTGKKVRSEGLLQLSYQDIRSYKNLIPEIVTCGIDWSKDKNLKDTDPKKTIFDPIINLNCGTMIFKYQIKTHKAIMLEKNVYWAVIKKGGKYNQIAGIKSRVKKQTPFCLK